MFLAERTENKKISRNYYQEYFGETFAKENCAFAYY